jgi:hypothetical protein
MFFSQKHYDCMFQFRKVYAFYRSFLHFVIHFTALHWDIVTILFDVSPKISEKNSSIKIRLCDKWHKQKWYQFLWKNGNKTVEWNLKLLQLQEKYLFIIFPLLKNVLFSLVHLQNYCLYFQIFKEKYKPICSGSGLLWLQLMRMNVMLFICLNHCSVQMNNSPDQQFTIPSFIRIQVIH